jgi:uncharacterized protein (UPF0332 family)
VTNSSFARTLVRKSKRALLSARVGLQIGDSDNAVNRSYYAMFDIACAALLKAGVAEDKLPRTHKGISEAFRNHAVQSGQIDPELAAELSRTESLRIKADYTGIEIDPGTAAGAVANAGKETRKIGVKPLSLEEERRQARENWLRLRQQQIQGARGAEPRRAADRGAGEDRSHSFDDDLDK